MSNDGGYVHVEHFVENPKMTDGIIVSSNIQKDRGHLLKDFACKFDHSEQPKLSWKTSSIYSSLNIFK